MVVDTGFVAGTDLGLTADTGLVLRLGSRVDKTEFLAGSAGGRGGRGGRAGEATATATATASGTSTGCGGRDGGRDGGHSLWKVKKEIDEKK